VNRWRWYRRKVAFARVRSASRQIDAGHYGRAVQSFLRSYEILRFNGFVPESLRVLDGAATQLVNARRPDDARWFAEEAMRCAKGLSDAGATAQALGGLASVAFEKSDYPSALELWSQSLAEAIRADNGELAFEAQEGVGLAQQKLQDLEGAEASYRKALALADELGDRRRHADQLANLGWLAQAQSRSCRPLFMQALEIYRERDDQRGIRSMEDELADEG
jgi:tetratricopeptide (TPR) repeat protein